ncbi:MAG: prepilin-type N-terminal cleavage/methylation domain-containing protein [Bacilli bacterium]|nr:prepilin-type N-terminal cleavage/methylation domain-containing protein [Bacilli bacterium]
MKKMNNKGFTLLEMMGVLILLAIILLVAIPSITKTMKKDQVNQLAKYEETLCDAAEAYITGEGINVTELKVSVLVSKGYVADNLSNPKTKKNATKDTLNIGHAANGKITCSLKD